MRLYVETPCEHGWISAHADGQGSELRNGEVVITWEVECSGGSRRPITVDPAEVAEARSALAMWDEDGFIDNNDQQRVMPLVRRVLAGLDP